jgi:hypothetical protein
MPGVDCTDKTKVVVGTNFKFHRLMQVRDPSAPAEAAKSICRYDGGTQYTSTLTNIFIDVYIRDNINMVFDVVYAASLNAR